MKRLVVITLISIFSTYLYADNADALEITIRFFDKSIYFSESTVEIKLELFNDGPTPVRFKLAESRAFSIDFDVRSATNVRAERSRGFIVTRGADSPVFFREIILEPGEHFAFVETLNDYIKMPNPGIYVVRAHFYPELYRSDSVERLISNALMLTVHPGTIESEPAVSIDIETGRILQQAALPPDEVVEFMLRARQKAEWEKFFLYIDLERLYTRTAGAAEQYARLSDDKRRSVLDQYRNSMMSPTTADDILLIPAEFEAQKTTYTRTEAQVLVIERFKYPGFTEIKEYTYYLSRRDRVWMVYDYAVRNLGAE